MEERKREGGLRATAGVRRAVSILHSFSPREAQATVLRSGSQSFNTKQGQKLCQVALITSLCFWLRLLCAGAY